MIDVVAFILICAGLALIFWLAHRGTQERQIPVTATPVKVHTWYTLLHDYDALTQRQVNDLDIKLLLPQEMREEIEELHRQFRQSL